VKCMLLHTVSVFHRHVANPNPNSQYERDFCSCFFSPASWLVCVSYHVVEIEGIVRETYMDDMSSYVLLPGVLKCEREGTAFPLPSPTSQPLSHIPLASRGEFHGGSRRQLAERLKGAMHDNRVLFRFEGCCVPTSEC
jgi:hypothetical protein